MARLEKFNLQSLASMTMTDELDLPSLGREKGGAVCADTR